MPLVELERPAPKSKRTSASIQKPDLASETSSASAPVARGVSGSSQITSAPAMGRKIRMVESQSLIGPR